MKISTVFREIRRYKKIDFLIYQMGKVGSSSVETVLNENDLSNIHLHSLYYNLQRKYYQLKSNRLDLIKSKILLYARLYALKLRNSKVKIITGVREPVSRNISAMFQSLHELIYIYMLNNTRKTESINDMLTNIFNNYIFHEWPIIWFDIEMKKYLHVDIYQFPFDREKGYTLINKGKYEILIIKMEKMSDLEHTIGEFVGLKDFKLKRINDASKKWYNEMYKDFKKNFKPTEKYINMMYNNKYMQHFYTDDEIQRFKKIWLNKR